MTSGGPRPLPLAAAKPSLGGAASGPLAPSPLAGWPPGTLATPPLSGCVLPDAGPGVRALPGGPASGPPPPGCLGFPAVPAQQWRPCSYRAPVRPGGGPLAVGRVLLPTPRTPQGSPGHGPGAPERPHAARRRRLRLSTAGIELGGSGSVVRAAVPSAPESRSRLFSVEKTGNFARLRQAEQATSRLTGRRHPLSRRKWKQLPISRAGGVPQLVCYGQQERPISSTASSCTTQYRRLIPSAFADKKPDPSNFYRSDVPGLRGF